LQHLLARVLRGELLVLLDARLRLRLPGARGHAHPLELTLQRTLERALRLLLLRQPVLLLIEPARVVPLPRDPLPAVELEDPLRHVVEEASVVRDRSHRDG